VNKELQIANASISQSASRQRQEHALQVGFLRFQVDQLDVVLVEQSNEPQQRSLDVGAVQLQELPLAAELAIGESRQSLLQLGRPARDAEADQAAQHLQQPGQGVAGLQHAVIDDADPLAQRLDLFHVVAGVDHRQPPAVEAAHFLENEVARMGID